jgi:hypothetical protein
VNNIDLHPSTLTVQIFRDIVAPLVLVAAGAIAAMTVVIGLATPDGSDALPCPHTPGMHSWPV